MCIRDSSITDFGICNFFELKASNLRTYYHKNILAFGDVLHRLHPLAGQGFNMTLRDIRDLGNLIELKLKNGLEIDNSICEEFQNMTKHKNYLFSSGIDFVYEFFNFESKMNNNILSRSVRFIGKNKFLNRSFKNIAIFLKDLFRNLFFPINLTDLLRILLFILLSKLKNSYTKSIPLEKR